MKLTSPIFSLILTAATLGSPVAAHAGTTDSVTVTVAWTLTNTSSNKDAAGHFAIYNDRGFYRYFDNKELDRFISTKKMPVRVPKEGLYTMIMNYTNKRPAASTMKKYIIREKIVLNADTVMQFKGSECTRHLGFNYTLPGGVPLKFMYKASGKPDDWTGATATQAIFQSMLVAKDQPMYDCSVMTSVKYGNSTLGNDRAKVTDIYFNPGLSDNFFYLASAIVHMADTVSHTADPTRPLVFISHRSGLGTTKKDSVVTNTGNFRLHRPAGITRSLYPVQDASSLWGYRVAYLNTDRDIARGTIMSGSIDNRAGEVAYDLAEGCDPLVLTLHQFETKQVRALCVESGCGIAHMPVRLGYGAEPTLYMEGNIAQGIVYNTLSEEHLFLIKPHPFYSYSPSDQTPEYGNSAPFLAFTFIASEPSPAYTFPYPTNTSNAEWVGNGGERRCVDLLSDGVSVIAGTDTIAAGWGKVSSALMAFEKTGHDPRQIRIIFDNRNFTVDGVRGHSRAEFSYLENEEDITPPSLTMVQLRDKNGRIGNKFDNLSDIDLYFNAADFRRTPPDMYLLNSPLTVKAEIASRGSQHWTELSVQDHAANTAMPTWGNGYKVDMSQYSHYNRDGWFDLRLTLTDMKGNTCVQTISPALLARGSANGVDGTCADSDIAVNFDGNSLTVSGTGTPHISVYTAGGQCALQGEGYSLDMTTLPAGVYLVKAVCGTAATTVKILKH